MKLKTYWIIALLTLFTAAFTVPLRAAPGEVPRIIFNGIGDKANNAIVNTTTETSIWPTGTGTNLIRANYWAAGGLLSFDMAGGVQFGTSGTLTLKVKLGENVIITSGAITPSIASQTNKSWRFTGNIKADSVGASGTFVKDAVLTLGDSHTNRVFLLDGQGQYSASTNLTVGTTTNLTFDVTATWSVATVSSGTLTNAIVTHRATLRHTR